METFGRESVGICSNGFIGRNADCDTEDEMVEDSHDIMLQRYLELGYSKAMAEALIREYYRYD